MSLGVILERDGNARDHTPDNIVFLPGELIRGRVRFTPDKETKLIGIYLQYSVFEHTAFTPSKKQIEELSVNRYGEKTPLAKGNRRRYVVKVVNTLWGNQFGLSGKQQEALSYEPRIGEWPFEFQIPLDANPTFSFKDGKICVGCEIRAFIHEPGLMKHKTLVESIRKIRVSTETTPICILTNAASILSRELAAAKPLHSEVHFGRIIADIKYLRNFTWPQDEFIFTMNLRTEGYSEEVTFKVEILQNWNAGSYDRKERAVAKFKVTYRVRPEYKTTWYGGKKRNPAVAQAVRVHMPGPDELQPTCSGQLVSLSYHLSLTFKGNNVLVPLHVLARNPDSRPKLSIPEGFIEAVVTSEMPTSSGHAPGGTIPYGQPVLAPGPQSPYPNQPQSYGVPPSQLSYGQPIQPTHPQYPVQSYPVQSHQPAANYSAPPPVPLRASQPMSVTPPPALPPRTHSTGPIAPPPKQSQLLARCLYQFDPANPWELALRVNDIVVVVIDDGEWIKGRFMNGPEGYFPRSFVELFHGTI